MDENSLILVVNISFNYEIYFIKAFYEPVIESAFRKITRSIISQVLSYKLVKMSGMSISRLSMVF